MFLKSKFLKIKKKVRGKLLPSPNSNANPKPSLEPDRGEIFLEGNFPDTKKDV